MTKAKVTIYTTQFCPYCVRAKNLLNQKGVPFTEVNLEGKPEELAALKERTKWRTVPQIFINDKLIGGFTELLALENSKELDKLLGES